MGRIDYTKWAGGQGRVKRDGEGSQDDELGSSQHDSDVSGFSLKFAMYVYSDTCGGSFIRSWQEDKEG